MSKDELVVRIFHALCLDNQTRVRTDQPTSVLWERAKAMAAELSGES